ncbi:MAG: TIR domain-containing protein [Candidatus Thiodiazotropha sp.]
MKPKIFIGSSVEGLNVAYAIQQNLTHDAESTVWDQGIFELSQTTIESLTKAVDGSDFGIFVFSPDDLTIMRGKENNTVRDNVIFEFGLFVGRLSRDRVFFITPETNDFHLPSDLLGLTPGKYNPNREDGSLQAATGPACNQIRQAIKRIPLLTAQGRENESDEAEKEKKDIKFHWITDLVSKNYLSAKNKLNKEMESQDDEELLSSKAWMAYINFKENEVNGLNGLQNIVKSNKDSVAIVSLVARMFTWEQYNDIALEILNEALLNFPGDPNLLVLQSKCLTSDGDRAGAIEALSNNEMRDVPEIAIALSEIYEEDDELDNAIECIHWSYEKYPSNRSVMYKYARLLQEKDCYKEALYLLNYLVLEHPKEVAYWGYLSNTCLQLNLYDKAMSSCKKALELSEGKEAWILHNIGNMLNNKGFYTEAEDWLNKGLKLDPQSEYAHNRLAASIKSRNEDQKQFQSLCQEGRILLRKYGQKEENSA